MEKVNLIFGAGRDTRNLYHKFNSQDPALSILDLWVASPKSQRPSSGVLGIRVPESQVLILDYALFKLFTTISRSSFERNLTVAFVKREQVFAY